VVRTGLEPYRFPSIATSAPGGLVRMLTSLLGTDSVAATVSGRPASTSTPC
jgi:hypothetical protein